MQFGATRRSKASYIEWLCQFLLQYDPTCQDKYVYLDQGDELYANSKVNNVFLNHHYDIFPTSTDSSQKNGPVKEAHQSICDNIRALLTGADMLIKFWLYTFFITSISSISLPLYGETHLEYFKQLERRRTLPVFEPLDTVCWSVLQASAKPSSNLM